MFSPRAAISTWAQRSSWVLILSLTLFGCSRQQGAKDRDAGFVERAAAGDLAEVRLGQLAQERGTSVAVKDFGAQMVADHTEAGNKLQIVARQIKLALRKTI
jgi:predicted outer membrane protein